MPFTRTSDPPNMNSLVTVEFAGQMLLKPGPDNTCIIGINRLSPAHTFKLILIVNKFGHPPTLEHLTQAPLTGDIAISLDPEPTHGDFKVFAAGEFNRQLPPDDPRDYRWAGDFNSLNPGADFNDGARPVANLSTGTLYTLDLSIPSLNPRFVRGVLTAPLNYIAANLAAAIQPPPRTKVRLTWSEFGQTQTKLLPRRTDPDNTTYTISLTNEPALTTLPDHEELDLYYRVLTLNGLPIPPEQHWRLEHDPDIKTDEIPCVPVILGP